MLDVESNAGSGFLDRISVLILTYNEAPNIARTLDALSRFSEVIVLDSASTDATAKIVASYPNARLVVRPFDDHAAQWNFGLESCGIERPWVLALDADYVLAENLVDEIAALRPAESEAGFRAAFCYCVYGRRLSASLYPAHVVLYRRERAHYTQEGHTQRVVVEGPVGMLRGRIDHDDRKPLSHWLSSQQRYAKLEADYLMCMPRKDLLLIDRIRRTGILGPFLVLGYTLIAKRCLFEGWPGWLYALQRMLAETMIAAELIDRRLGRVVPATGSQIRNPVVPGNGQ